MKKKKKKTRRNIDGGRGGIENKRREILFPRGHCPFFF